MNTHAPAGDALAGQPIARVRRGDIEYVLLGTAHVSRVSADAVRAILQREAFDAVAVELCEPRYQSIRDPEAFRRLDLFQVIRQGKVGLVAANLALSAFQRRLAEQFGIEPGAEMKAAIDGADERGLPVWLVDREIGITLKRAYHSVGFLDRLSIVGGLGASVLSREDVSEDEIEKLKRGDLLGSMFSEFARESPPLYDALIGERDRYMTARLREQAAAGEARRVLVVIGAGHLAGIERELANQNEMPRPLVEKLSQVPPPSRWPKWLAFGVFLVIAGAIGFAFTRGARAGTDALLAWTLFTGGGAALGAIAAAAHPLSVIAAFVTAPLKPFRPGVPASAFSAGVEAWLRKPRVADFDSLRDDVAHWTGWWKNRIARTLLNFMFVTLGTVVGEYLAGFHIIKNLL
ncbi:TraB/GumN family protein [Dokdonella fugitiva]|jgi:pheromone shutdown-related protein TraB|uniref:Pheromone shutdown-related protein TraB n=1 Tax=Dokdonella fugitiva TaxID=328517 RepID=A0A4R2I7E4_9GAMM|nr:TraB/GumN family protein [Dokdonella fugitiva]MBA8883301.1 pheromone shutdown-related protein TraB [Dokdonella fugitiva]TCO40253.1 pheromone shutdown-related protein TraB [Dokdonella fugitiva]